MERQEALEILKKYTTQENLIKHAYAVEGTMMHFAKLNNEDEKRWRNYRIIT